MKKIIYYGDIPQFDGGWTLAGRFEKYEDAVNFIEEKWGIDEQHAILFITPCNED